MLDRNTTVARAVLDHSECAPVFQRHRIDYCCHGNRSIADACASAGVDAGNVLGELVAAIESRRGAPATSFESLPTTDLIAYIVSKHHTYLREAFPFVLSLAAKVARVHGGREERLQRLDGAVRSLAEALLPHLDFEERTLFPALIAGDAQAPTNLAAMHEDHLAVAELLRTIRSITADFTYPVEACNSYRTLFAELEAVEADVFQHVHLENHVLMKRFEAPGTTITA